ncbi:FAD dependent oxidoreductase [Variovorax sp. OK605]|uniref:FAD-dependent oxidoreductase n=1 Tax=Variovorax sp. OK605 TaxID=1855317 RepID=UPI0008E8BCB1|nr:FAD-dependent oxidoreductase [Variovorax sp. OK605]SFP89848.1 FAD dependent oxidoreductase [Variovorax sp. OK605]
MTAAAQAHISSTAAPGAELEADIVVIGGGLGGVSAALAAARQGARVVLVEELDWLGGQLTAQAVPPDEHPWIESLSASQSYAALRHGIRAYYRTHMPLTEAARGSLRLNPGQGNVSTLCHEPWVAVKVIDSLLAPHVAAGRVTVLRQHRLLQVQAGGDRLRAVRVRDLVNECERVLQAPMFIDATETGDVLEMAQVEHVFGAEARSRTGEPHALAEADPFDQQAITWCLAADYLPGEDHTIDKPAAYDRLKTLQLDCWPGPQFSWTLSDFVTHQPRERPLFVGPSDAESLYDLWHARRIAWRLNFEPGAYASDITLANWPQMDYWEKPIVGVAPQAQAQALEEARQFSLAFFYWMQTDAPRHDGGCGYRGLRLRGDVLGTSDGLAKQAYYREGRRIEAEFTVLEQHVGVKARPGQDAAESFFDSVGIGAYRIDLHPSTRGRNTVDIDSFPFQIPLGALLPVRVDNLLPACKNLGTTRVTNGAYREHATEWSIGEASGTLAAFALARRQPPRAVRADAALLADFQATLERQGVLLAWPAFGALTPTRRVGYKHAAA